MNPWNTEETARSLKEALEMQPEQRKANMGKLFAYVNKYTASNWGVSFINELKVKR